jgi:transposase
MTAILELRGASWTDTVSKMIRHRSQRPQKSAPAEMANHFAARHNAGGSFPAPQATRPFWTSPSRVNRRSPTPVVADAQKAERTTPLEGSCISSPVPRPARRVRAVHKMNTEWTKISHFAALDWAKDHHDVCVVDQQGLIVAQFRFEHSAKGWSQFREKMKAFPEHTPITLETSSGPAVDQLLSGKWPIYPLAPTAAVHYRQRKAPSGNKADNLDAWSMADALRTDGHAWRVLLPQDEATATLRALCRDEISLIEQRTALVNQLRATLRDYYPAALEAFEDWTQSYTWDFLLQFPTPQRLQAAGKRKWEKFLHAHRLWRPSTTEHRLSVFAQGNALPARASTVAAKELLAVSLAKVLRTLQQQIDEYRRRIGDAFRAHPDHDIFGSLPGAKEILAPRLLAELGSLREEYPDPEALQCLAGASPVSYQSGQINKCRLRRACNKILRATVHLWTNASRATCEWAQTYYERKRSEGKSHASALRCLAKRWLKILWALWQNGQKYDEAVHLENLRHSGSLTATALSTSSIN